ncbi:MAG: relaxase/mobilization nuclease [Clostridia bacterium]|nr:relaxase/mobilization nuclease [Clostridia bacterium]
MNPLKYVVSNTYFLYEFHGLWFNATNFDDYHKYVANKKSYYKIRRISDRICKEHGLSVIPDKQNKGKSYKEYTEYKRGTSWKGKLKYAVDKAIWTSTSFDEFLIKMKEAGYEIRQGKNIAFRAPEQVNFTNMKTLGTYYTEEQVLKRLEKNRYKARTPKVHSKEVRLFVQVSSFIENDNRAGYDRWAKLNNLKEAARTFNYLSENNLLNIDDFNQRIQDIESAITANEQQLKQVDQQMSAQKLIQKHSSTYRRCKKIVDSGKTSSQPDSYRKNHSADYNLYASSKKALHEMGVEKLPNPDRLQSKIGKLESSRIALEAESKKLLKEKKTLEIVSTNMAMLDLAENHIDKSTPSL